MTSTSASAAHSGLFIHTIALLAGPTVFWVPDVLVHAWAAQGFRAEPWLLMTTLLPLATVTAILCLLWMLRRGIVAPSLSAVLGIWIAGPLMMIISATFSGGGFATPFGVPSVVIGTLLFPLFCPWLAFYDGTIFALAITTLLLPICAVILKTSLGLLSRQGTEIVEVQANEPT